MAREDLPAISVPAAARDDDADVAARSKIKKKCGTRSPGYIPAGVTGSGKEGCLG